MSVVKECVPVSLSEEKKHLFYTNCICTPECQEGAPPYFTCTGYDVQYILATDSFYFDGGADDKYKIMTHQAHAQRGRLRA